MRINLLFIGLLLTGMYASAQEDENYLVTKIKSHSDVINAVSFSDDEKMVASGGDDKTIYVTSLPEGDKLYSFENNYYPIKDLLLMGDNNIIYTSGNALKLITLDGDELFTYPPTSTHIQKIGISPNSKHITTGSYDRNVKVWEFVSGIEAYELEGHDKSAMAINLNNKYIVTGASDNLVRIWDEENGSLLNTLEGHTDVLWEIEFIPNTNFFASAGRDKIIRIWDAKQGRIRKTYVGHDKGITDIEFTSDGVFMLSASYDNTVNVWEVSTGELIYSFYTHEHPVMAIDISNNDTYLATASADKTVMVWKLKPWLFVDYKYPDKIIQYKTEHQDLFSQRQRGEDKDLFNQRHEKATQLLLKEYHMLYKQYTKSLPPVFP